MSVRKYIFYVVLLAGVLTLLGYYYLGGFTERSVELVAVNDYHLAGIRYQGKLGTDALEEIFYEVQDKVRDGSLAGTMAIMVLKEPQTGKDSVDQYVGVLLENPGEASLPQGWERFTIEASQALRSSIRAHNLVMPSPKEIRDEIQDYARKHELPLRTDVTIEKYLGERHLEVEIPLQEQ
jgi:hypothetical protein